MPDIVSLTNSKIYLDGYHRNISINIFLKWQTFLGGGGVLLFSLFCCDDENVMFEEIKMF